MLLSLLGQDTAREPMAGLMRQARAAEKLPGVLSVSLMAGFPYADVPEVGASVIAVADGNGAEAKNIAEELAGAMWAVREQLNVPCPRPEEAVRRALACTRPPALLIDLGDNIGGGSAGDGTVLLAELLKQRAHGFVVAMYAPSGVAQAKDAGVGRPVEVTVGGTSGDLHGPPVKIRGVVRSLHDGKWVESEARHGGRRQNDRGHTAVLDLADGNLVVLNSLRTPPFSLGQLTSLGIDPRLAKVIVVKAAVAYKAAYAAIWDRDLSPAKPGFTAASAGTRDLSPAKPGFTAAPSGGAVIEVDTPGLTAINAARFQYKRIRRPMYPLDAGGETI
jgi:microcystin degradation protein MlrC